MAGPNPRIRADRSSRGDLGRRTGPRPPLDPGSGQLTDGTDLRGTLVDGGVDWQTVRSDGTVELRARYVLITDRDETIEVQSEGLRVTPSDADEHAYFRTHIRLSTAAPRLAHLNNRIAVSTGERLADAVHVRVHEVL
jgi:hypothetical protein